MKIDPLTDQERRVVRTALTALISSCGRRVEASLAAALLMARIEEAARDLCSELVRDARSAGPPDLVGDRRGIRHHDAVGAVAIRSPVPPDSDALASVTSGSVKVTSRLGEAARSAHGTRGARGLCWLRIAQPAYL